MGNARAGAGGGLRGPTAAHLPSLHIQLLKQLENVGLKLESPLERAGASHRLSESTASQGFSPGPQSPRKHLLAMGRVPFCLLTLTCVRETPGSLDSGGGQGSLDRFGGLERGEEGGSPRSGPAALEW